MDIPKLLVGLLLIIGYLALRLGWTYKRDMRRGSKKQSLGDTVETVLLLVLGVVMLAGGMYFIVLAMAS